MALVLGRRAENLRRFCFRLRCRGDRGVFRKRFATKSCAGYGERNEYREGSFASAGEPSARENWQSGHALHRRDEFHALVEAIQATTRKVLSFLEIASDDFDITGCWANVNGIGASHGVHTHPNNFLSGVYYVQTQAGADTINFHDP
jgi:uncharacterized protein (TIGR02466 family)